jgi:hypothetical protein
MFSLEIALWNFPAIVRSLSASVEKGNEAERRTAGNLAVNGPTVPPATTGS